MDNLPDTICGSMSTGTQILEDDSTNNRLAPSASFQFRLTDLFLLGIVSLALWFVERPQDGLLFGVTRSSVVSFSGDEVDPRQQIYTFLGILRSFPEAIAITLGLISLRSSSRISATRQPGYWLLIDIAMACLSYALVIFAGWAAVAIHGDLVDDNGDFTESGGRIAIAILSFGALLLVARVLFNVYIARQICCERWWRYVFYSKAVSVLAQLSSQLLNPWCFLLGDPLAAILTCAALTIDNRRHINRSGIHYCGVVVQIIDIVVSSATAYFVLT